MSIQRQQKLNRIFREEISDLLLRHLKDPRLGLITITEVRVSPDLSQAIIFVSPQGDEESRQTSLEGLLSAAGHIRSELSRKLRLKKIPELDFRLDNSQIEGDRVLQLIDQVSRELHGSETEK
jgi:ribosome-binding factor A